MSNHRKRFCELIRVELRRHGWTEDEITEMLDTAWHEAERQKRTCKRIASPEPDRFDHAVADAKTNLIRQHKGGVLDIDQAVKKFIELQRLLNIPEDDREILADEIARRAGRQG